MRARLNLSDRVRFLKSNLLENVEGSFDLIVANLPYISTQDRHTLSREVLHDPEVALFASAQGDELVRELIAAGAVAAPPGWNAGPGNRNRPERSASFDLGGKNYRDICSKNDYSGMTRFLFARYG